MRTLLAWFRKQSGDVAKVRVDHDAEAVLSREEERDLARQMEAGVLARELRLSGAEVPHAEAAELQLIEEEGDRARRRFISANLPLVSLVIRELAPRKLFPEPDLFQEGCVALATCQVGTGSDVDQVASPLSGIRPDRALVLNPSHIAAFRVDQAVFY